MTAPLALTWWGHASTTVELGSARVAMDPLLSNRLLHLRRRTASPSTDAFAADIVLVSHLHADHLHVPSLRRFGHDVPLVVPRGAQPLLRGIDPGRVRPVEPGDVLEVGGVRITVLPATHDGRRHPFSRARGPALGFRVDADGWSAWFPGDTELRDDMADVGRVDLALVPVGGWGPTLEHGHMGPEDGAAAVGLVGATWAVPVHWGTFWPVGIGHVWRENHHRLFTTPGLRFEDALAASGDQASAVLATHGERVEL